MGGFSFFFGLYNSLVISLPRSDERTYGSRLEFGPFSSPQLAQIFSPGA